MAKLETHLSALLSEHDAYWFYDFESKLLSFSPGCENYFGKGMDSNKLRDIFFSFRGKGNGHLMDVIDSFNETHPPLSQVFTWEEDNRELWFDCSLYYLKLSEWQGVFGHLRDITSIYQFKKRYQLIKQMSQGLDICMWEIDLERKTITLDFPGGQGESGTIPLDAQLQLIHPDDRQSFQDYLDKMMAGVHDIDYEGRVSVSPQGDKWKWIRAIGVKVNSLVKGFSYKIDQERENDVKIASLNEELNQSKHAIQQAYTDQQQFVADVTTEMRPPLDLIISGIQVIEEQCTIPSKSSLIETIKGASFGLLKLVNGLFDVIKIQGQFSGPGQDQFDIKKTIVTTSELIALGLSLSDKTGVNFSFSSQPPMMVYGHYESMKKLISHTIAMIFNEIIEGMVQVDLQLLEKKASKILQISFMMPSIISEGEKFDSMEFFENYLQKGDATKLNNRSFDFGMTVLRKYAELVGAKIEIKKNESSKTFIFTLPYRPVLEKVELSKNNKLRILIVDDIELNRELMQMYLEEVDCDIMESEDGNEAIQLFQKYHFDLIFMDLQMPLMSGHDAVVIMRQMERDSGRKHAMIAAISAYAIAEEVDRCLESGFDMAFDKPVPKEKILALVDECAGKNQKAD